MQKLLLSFATLVLLLPNLYDADLCTELPYDGKEKFNASLSWINSIPKLEKYTDSIACSRNAGTRGYEYVQLLESVIEDRFYHGFSHYGTGENWIASFAGKLVKEDYACKVDPNEILQHPNAACSQQSIVMMAVLRNKHIPYRSVGFPHHYAIEVLLNNEWYFFDANMEPVITKEERALANWAHRNDNIKKYYNENKHTNLDFQFGKNCTATNGIINEVPAQHAGVFHMITGILSKTAWLLPLLILFLKGGFHIEVPFITLVARRKKPLVSLPA